MDQRLIDYLASLGASPSALDGWTVHTAQRADVDVAFVITRGPEIHMLSLVGPRAMSRRNIAAFLYPILEEHGYATTRVPLSETDHRLRLALGFSQQWADENYTYWALTKRPYDRQQQPEGTPPCLS
jgi:hypothetical protein